MTEKMHVFKISKNKESAIIVRYPFWMKWLMRFVDCYFIPDTKDNQLKVNYDYSYKFLSAVPPKFKNNIGAIA